jgi:hypothetical protein
VPPTALPAWRVRSFLTQKQGSSWRECEDACASSARHCACAVADGATEAFGSRWWARLLARSWVRAPATEPAAFLEMIGRLAARAQRRWARRPLPWYAEEKRQQGSYAAFAGVRFEQDAAGLRWQAVALGDCCLLQLRGGALVGSQPLSEPEQFGFRPTLLPTRPEALAGCASAVGSFSGTAEPGDCFLLLSDAAACWLLQALREAEASAAQFLELLQQGSAEPLAALIAELRRSGRMRNDDVAAIAIAFGPP